MNNKNTRAASNLALLEFIARKLGKLKDEVVFLGGCTTVLLIGQNYLYNMIYNGIYYIRSTVGTSPCSLPGYS